MALKGNQQHIITVSPQVDYRINESNWLVVTDEVILPTISITGVNASEPGSHGTFTVTRTGSTTDPITVNYSISGTAINGTDYETIGTSAVILSGQASKAIPIVIIDDNDIEGSESVILTIVPSLNYQIGSSSATIQIVDNETPIDTGNITILVEYFLVR